MSIKPQKLLEMGRRLREDRQRIGLSQTDLAAAGDVANQTVNGYEKGLRAPDGVFLANVQRAGIDISFVLNGRRTEALAADSVDWSLVDAIYAGMDDAFDDLSIEIKPEKRVELARVLYEHFITQHRIEPSAFKRIVRLAAA